MELFLNRVWATLSAGVDGAVTVLPLTAGHGARFGAIPAGNKVRIVLLDASSNVSEIMYATAIAGDNLTVTRGQDGTAGAAHLAGDRIEVRIGKSTMDSLMQAEDIQAGAATLLGTVAGVDVITAAANPTLSAQAATGSLWKLPAAGANTGAVTVNIDGQGAVSVVRSDGTPLLANDIPAANYPCLIEKRAADFVLINPANMIVQNGFDLAGQTHTAFTTAGTGDAFTLSPTLPLTAYAANQRYRVKFHVAAAPASQTVGPIVVGQRYTITAFVAGDDFTNVGAANNASGVTFIATGTTPTVWTNASTLTKAATINVSTIGGKALARYNAAGTKIACDAADIAANMLSDVEYDGTDFILLDALKKKTYQAKVLVSGSEYRPDPRATEFYVFVSGAVGGTKTQDYSGGSGGGGYSEKYYAAPFASSYSYSIGAAGIVTGAGGTTTFDTISITGSGPAGASSAGGAGGVASGGDFNSNGGAGGNGYNGGGSPYNAFGGGGAGGSRCGAGYAGGNATQSVGGAGGGTGGAAAGATPGVAGTVSGAALVIPQDIGVGSQTFSAGNARNGVNGGDGASGAVTFDAQVPVPAIGSDNGGRSGASKTGSNGKVVIIEVIA